MTERSDISLGDLLSVLDQLEPDPAAADAIFRVLRLEHLKQTTAGAIAGGYEDRQGSSQRTGPLGIDAGLLVSGKDAAVELPEGSPLPVRIREIPSRSIESVPPWKERHIVALASAPATSAEPPRSEPLFPNLRQRAILAAALASWAPEGDLDLASILDRLVRRQPFSRLPRRPIPTLRRGVQLLLDYSESMIPFAVDRRHLRGSIENLVGTSRTPAFFFKGSPERGVRPVRHRATRDRVRDWDSPPRGTVVILISDLGIGGSPTHPERASFAEWRAFARRALAAGCPVVAFVPFPPRRWDWTLARDVIHIHWDHRTTARSIKRAASRSIRV